ncbi:hypothetical protein RJ639_011800 [Escallonia herrerae]|uniref:DELLA protein RGL1 n=1 Tax=Escallonia herrerae TaxID=1293975 RepID=A0AA88VME6_9ASTE|nr:hypothetical protein RJ639_011800 [Escallonia herrerae]
MEATNVGWLSFPMHYESLNQDLAIRRFCPARRLHEIEQEQLAGVGEYWGEDEALTLHEIELWSPTHTTPRLAASEEVKFVDSFLNTDCHDVEHNDSSPEMHQASSSFDDDLNLMGNFSMAIDDLYGDIPMMIGDGDELDQLSSSCEDVVLEEMLVPAVEEVSHGVDQGLHLVHLLLACAEAVGCRDTQLANSMLAQIWSSSASPWGDSLQRVSYCFALGLQSRLSLLQSVNANGTFTNTGATDVSLVTRQEKTQAFHLLHQTTPYISFGFMAANDAICQAAQGKDSLHIIDVGMEHTLQWPSLIKTLASRTEGPPKLVRITGIIGNQEISELESSMKGVIDESSLLGIPLEFRVITEPATPFLLTRENLNLREGEALFFNSIMHLHKYVKESRGSLKAILQAIKKLGPTLLTMVEQDANHNGPFFLGRFLESLHYYSAIFDSLEASLPRNSTERMKMEKLHYAEEIHNIMAYEGSNRIERHERADQWRRQLGRAGFQVVGLKSTSQARSMVSVYGCDGYTLASEKGCLLLGWKGRPIMLASAWQVHSTSSS